MSGVKKCGPVKPTPNSIRLQKGMTYFSQQLRPNYQADGLFLWLFYLHLARSLPPSLSLTNLTVSILIPPDLYRSHPGRFARCLGPKQNEI